MICDKCSLAKVCLQCAQPRTHISSPYLGLLHDVSHVYVPMAKVFGRNAALERFSPALICKMFLWSRHFCSIQVQDCCFNPVMTYRFVSCWIVLLHHCSFGLKFRG